MKAAIACLTIVIVGSCMSGGVLAAELPTFGYPLAEGTFAEAMTTGPDDNLWFVGRSTRNLVVGKVTPGGDVTEIPLSVSGARADSIVTGPDGNLWFVEWAANAIGRSTTDGEVISFLLPESKSRPTAITAGPDGNLWFAEGAASKIGRITPRGQITEFPLSPSRHPSGIVAGPDGDLWFTERGANWIGRITTAGRITEFPVPGPWAKLSAITAGSDGNLWFSEEATPKIGRITLGGRVTQFAVPTEEGTHSIVSGPGGQLWFGSGNEVGAISTSGAIAWPACLVPFCEAPPEALAVGPEGSLWVGVGVKHCTSPCGGGTGISFQLLPGGVGRYALPPLTLAIGPRVPPVRDGRTSLSVACGLSAGCRGLLRLGFFEYSGGRKRYQVLAKRRYDLGLDEAKRIRVRLSKEGIEYLRESSFFAIAVAGPKGQIQAKRSIRLSLPPGRQDKDTKKGRPLGRPFSPLSPLDEAGLPAASPSACRERRWRLSAPLTMRRLESALRF